MGFRPFTSAPRAVAAHGALGEAFGRADLTEVVRQVERLYDGHTFSLRTLFHDEQASILERLLADRTAAVEEMYESIYQQAAPLMRFMQSLEQPAPPAFLAAAEYTLMARLRRELARGREVDLERVTTLVEEAKEASVALDPVVLGLALQSALEALLAELRATPDDFALLTQTARVASFAAGSPWKMELGEAQNAVWTLSRALLPRWAQAAGDPKAPERRRLLKGVAANLGMHVAGLGSEAPPR